MRHLTAALLLGVAATASAQNVLVYDTLSSGELSWYSGFGGLGVTLADEATWMGMTTAQFAAYDLIWIGGIDELTSAADPYITLNATELVWAPAVSGRVVANCLHVSDSLHTHAGAIDFVDDAVTWLLGAGAGTTSLWAGQDVGLDAFDFMSEFGISGCSGANCFNEDQVLINMPAHPVMANSTPATLSGWDQSVHNRITTLPGDWDLLATGPLGEFLVVARELLPAITNPCLPCATVGASYSGSLHVAGGVAPYVFGVVAPAVLPPGLILDPGTGQLSGTLAAAGSFPFTVRVTDAGAPPRFTEVELEVSSCESPCPVGLCGDCDGDGRRTLLDSLTAAQFAVGVSTFPSAVEFASCNVEGAQAPDPTADVTVADALTIARYQVGLETLQCCSPGKEELLSTCQDAHCGQFYSGEALGDLSDYATTHYFALDDLPLGRGLRVTVTGGGAGDLDLYVGAPGTLLGDESAGNYAYSAVSPSASESILIDRASTPFDSGDYLGSEVAIVVKSVILDSYSLELECLCDPIDITGAGTYAGDTTGLPDTGDSPCGPASAPELAFDYTLTQTSDLTISTDNPGTLADTVIYVAGNGCISPLEIIGCDDDGGTGTTSLLQLPFVLPGTCTIVVEAGAGGQFELTVTEVASVGCPTLEGAIPASGPFPHVVMGDTTGADRSVDISCQAGDEDHVYEFTPAFGGYYQIDTCGAGPNSVLEVRESECLTGNVVACNVTGPVGCAPGSLVQTSLSAGVTYLITVAQVVGLGGAPYTLTVDALGICAATVDADLTGVSLPISHAGVTTGAADSFTPGCGAATSGGDHILQYVPSTTGSYCIDTCGSSFDTVLEVFHQDCLTGASIGCNDDGMTCAPQSQLAGIVLTAGEVYFIRISGVGGAEGPSDLNITSLPTEIPYQDPMGGGHFLGVFPGLDEAQTGPPIQFMFPFWISPFATSSTTRPFASSNGALRLGNGGTAPMQAPLWTFASGGVPTIHAHGADGFPAFGGGVYYRANLFDRAYYTWLGMDYGPAPGQPGGWTVQVVLLDSGDFQIRQVAATSDAGRTITIGFSDGLAADSSAPGATGLDWDAFPVGQPTPLGMVDIGSSEPGGMATGVVLYFQFDPVAGYLVTRLQ